jgi:aerobic-type carbon monoxide dehydrogenase small subunit (CoxS/CutS family)
MAEVVGQTRKEEDLEEDINSLLSGHLCRCTGYLGIKAALRDIAHITSSHKESGT